MPKPDRAMSPSDDLLQSVAATMALLATPVRLHLLWLLSHGEQDVSTLAEAVGQSTPTTSHHLNKLKLAGMVADRAEGRHRVYAAVDPDAVALTKLAITQRMEANRSGRRRRRA